VGQFAQIQVANGSRFTLAPSSRLTLVEHGNHVRSAVLIGEARFDIVPDSRAPFEVRTGRVVTRVLGTTFDVRRYADDTIGHVSVLSGKVTTTAIGHGTPLTLTAGMSARFTDSVIFAKGSINRNSYIDWEHGHLVFRDAPVPVVLDVLSKWYAYRFQVMDSAIARRHITATFAFGDSAEMLRLLKRVLRASMTVQDSVVMLRPGRRGAESTPAPERYKEHNPFIHSREFGR
jgi:transmembrane sensor